MDIACKMLLRLSGASQTDSSQSNTPKSHSRKLSYEEVKISGTVDYIVALCAGNKAALLLERKRTLAYFQSLPDTSPAAAPESWANAIGGEIVGVRVAKPSFRAPWQEPNAGITFRYRHHVPVVLGMLIPRSWPPGTESSSSCSTTCTTFDHHPYQPSFESRRSSATTVDSPPTLIKHEIRDRKLPTVHQHVPRVNHHKTSSAATAPTSISKVHSNPRGVLKATIRPEQAATRKKAAEDDFEEQINDGDAELKKDVTAIEIPSPKKDRAQQQSKVKPVKAVILTTYRCLDPEGKDTKYAELAEKEFAESRRHEQQPKRPSYFGSAREVEVIRTYMRENPHVFSNLTKEAAFEAVRITGKDWWRPSGKELFRDEQAEYLRQKKIVKAGNARNAQINAGLAILRSIRQRSNTPDVPARAAAAPNTLPKGKRSQPKLAQLKRSGLQYQNHTKQAVLKAGSRQRSYQRQPFAFYSEDELKHFKQYPNTYADLKDPTNHPTNHGPRRALRFAEYFLKTRWRVGHRPRTGHCKDFLQMRSFNSLMLRNTVEPHEVARKVAAREKIILEGRRGQSVPLFNAPKRPAPRRGSRYTRANVRPVKREFATATRSVQVSTAQAVTQRGVRRNPVQGKVEKKIEKAEKDRDCAIESDTEDEDMETSVEWDSTCFIEPEQ